MVFIHGGAFVTGSNSKMIYGPEFLLREDVILVVINYRIGFLGFLSLQDPSLGVPGNAGLKDMVLALKWVNRNIKKFNGDPNNVTIFGESAGASCVHLLMLSPSAKGLFQRAIAQSGCAFNLWARSCKLEPLLSEALGIDEHDGKKILHKLQSMTVEELHEFQDKFPDRWDISMMRAFGYAIENPDQNDQPFLTKDPVEIMKKGDYNKVPLLLGFNSREGMLIHVFLKTPIKEILPNIEQHVPFNMNLIRGSNMSKSVAEQIMRFYFNDKDPKFEDNDLNYKFLTDNFFVRDIYKFALMYSQSSFYQCFLYEMTLVTSINLFKNFSGIKSPGVCHADDISYLFKTAMHVDIKPDSPEDKGIRRFCRLWANFAKYGNPNAITNDNLLPVVWQPFSTQDRNYLEIGEELQAKRNPAHERMMFWKELYSKHVKHKL
ncbi:hypothetical protein WA026_007868 [Henosepilachna vigintioctopunctata]|uniref:Carboxylesterase type B domain-containing protein n=1 Tax=Henosepilachna vigintioctopunctata TaxID=420089 RepID=A0AAW1U6F2_9CUCU